MFSLSDFIRNTRAPRKRLPPVREDPLKRLFFSPHIIIGGILLLLSLTLGAFILARAAQWNGKRQFALLIVGGTKDDVVRPLTIVSVDGLERRATIMPLPDDLMIDTLYGYGAYKASSLQGLATLEKRPPAFLTQSLALQFGIDLKGIVWVKEAPNTWNAQSVARIMRSALFFGSNSTLFAVDRYGLWRFLGSLRKDQVTLLDMRSSGMVKDATAQGAAFDPMRADPILFALFSDIALRKEDKTIAVVNATNEPRLGTRVARALANIGASVTNVSTAPQEMENTALSYADTSGKNSLALGVVIRTLHLEKSAVVHQPEKNAQYRADLVILIGKDMSQALGTRN